MAEADARDTMMSTGVFNSLPPRARSLIPSLIENPMTPDLMISRGVIGFVASMRPASIQVWRRSRFSSIMTGARLQRVSSLVHLRGAAEWGSLLVDEADLAMADNQWCLTTLEPRVDAATLLVALVATAGRLAIAGRGTAANTDPLLVGALVVREAREDGCAPGLWPHREGGEEGDEAGRSRRSPNCCRAAPRRLRKW